MKLLSALYDWFFCKYARSFVPTGIKGVTSIKILNKSFSVQHIHMFKIENNLITEHFACRDNIEMYQQLSVLAPPPAFAPPIPSSEKKVEDFSKFFPTKSQRMF